MEPSINYSFIKINFQDDVHLKKYFYKESNIMSPKHIWIYETISVLNWGENIFAKNADMDRTAPVI